MAKYNESSILRGVHTDDVDSIRRIMNGLLYRLSTLSSTEGARLACLTSDEQILVDAIHRASRNNSLLQRIIIRFASARYLSGRAILELAADLDSVAVQAVLDPTSRPANELAMAEDHFDQMVEAGAFIYYPRGENELGDIEPDTEPEERNENTEDEDGDEDEDEMEDAEGGEVAELWKNDKSKHKPIRKSGEQCIDDGAYDREPAKIGNPDPSKMIITLRAQRCDLSVGSWVPADDLTWVYRGTVDWDNKESIAKLNNWRTCNFNRQLGPKHPPRELWLESERDRLCSIVEDHLKTRLVHGCWRLVAWDRVAEAYNSELEGVIQRAGEKSALRHYPVGRKHITSLSHPLKMDRIAPLRTAHACRNQIEQFLDDRAQRIVEDAHAADQQDLITKHSSALSKAQKRKQRASAAMGKEKIKIAQKYKSD